MLSSTVEEPLDLVKLSLDERDYVKMRSDRDVLLGASITASRGVPSQAPQS
ncbi:hypothetical protein KIN20_011510 [Parelaphostrongylus tenuis]|uniref:Uncharacterized protein n=1 Tax=Parelaphostrongylus tenuis TaxID=148309 RepID=A0AAD5QM35_PARTN|nr:hypothetical protein KIN20_011510 [Parelaphostrongylus tenuis]